MVLRHKQKHAQRSAEAPELSGPAVPPSTVNTSSAHNSITTKYEKRTSSFADHPPEGEASSWMLRTGPGSLSGTKLEG